MMQQSYFYIVIAVVIFMLITNSNHQQEMLIANSNNQHAPGGFSKRCYWQKPGDAPLCNVDGVDVYYKNGQWFDV
jgi:hypothetical protein